MSHTAAIDGLSIEVSGVRELGGSSDGRSRKLAWALTQARMGAHASSHGSSHKKDRLGDLHERQEQKEEQALGGR